MEFNSNFINSEINKNNFEKQILSALRITLNELPTAFLVKFPVGFVSRFSPEELPQQTGDVSLGRDGYVR